MPKIRVNFQDVLESDGVWDFLKESHIDVEALCSSAKAKGVMADCITPEVRVNFEDVLESGEVKDFLKESHIDIGALCSSAKAKGVMADINLTSRQAKEIRDEIEMKDGKIEMDILLHYVDERMSSMSEEEGGFWRKEIWDMIDGDMMKDRKIEMDILLHYVDERMSSMSEGEKGLWRKEIWNIIDGDARMPMLHPMAISYLNGDLCLTAQLELEKRLSKFAKDEGLIGVE